ncbi:hypothetical protein BDR26DRAFT_872048, partial [Obelidium mucronatum]
RSGALQHDAAATDDEREYQLLAEAEQFYSGRSLIERKQLYSNTYTSRNAKEHASLPPAPPSTAPTAPKASKNIPSLFTDDEVFHVGGAVEPWAEAEKDAFNEFHVQLHNTNLTNFLFPSTFGGGGGNGITPSWESRQPGLVGTANNPNNSNTTSNNNNNSSSLGNKDGGVGGKQPKKRKPGATGASITGVVKYSIPPPMAGYDGMPVSSVAAAVQPIPPSPKLAARITGTRTRGDDHGILLHSGGGSLEQSGFPAKPYSSSSPKTQRRSQEISTPVHTTCLQLLVPSVPPSPRAEAESRAKRASDARIAAITLLKEKSHHHHHHLPPRIPKHSTDDIVGNPEAFVGYQQFQEQLRQTLHARFGEAETSSSSGGTVIAAVTPTANFSEGRNGKHSAAPAKYAACSRQPSRSQNLNIRDIKKLFPPVAKSNGNTKWVTSQLVLHRRISDGLLTGGGAALSKQQQSNLNQEILSEMGGDTIRSQLKQKLLIARSSLSSKKIASTITKLPNVFRTVANSEKQYVPITTITSLASTLSTHLPPAAASASASQINQYAKTLPASSSIQQQLYHQDQHQSTTSLPTLSKNQSSCSITSTNMQSQQQSPHLHQPLNPHIHPLRKPRTKHQQQQQQQQQHSIHPLLLTEQSARIGEIKRFNHNNHNNNINNEGVNDNKNIKINSSSDQQYSQHHLHHLQGESSSDSYSQHLPVTSTSDFKDPLSIISMTPVQVVSGSGAGSNPVAGGGGGDSGTGIGIVGLTTKGYVVPQKDSMGFQLSLSCSLGMMKPGPMGSMAATAAAAGGGGGGGGTNENLGVAGGVGGGGRGGGKGGRLKYAAGGAGRKTSLDMSRKAVQNDCKHGVDPVLLASKLAKNMHSIYS